MPTTVPLLSWISAQLGMFTGAFRAPAITGMQSTIDHAAPTHTRGECE
jgi:hypothetical protein